MTTTLVDTNVLLDLLTNDLTWAQWSIAQLDAASMRGAIAINDVVYAELSVRFETIEALDAVLAEARVVMLPMPRAALFLAAKAFARDCTPGGVRTGVPPDFCIGAHAAVAGSTLLSRDAGRYRSYFPALDLITPP